MAFHLQKFFLGGDGALIPKRFAKPRIGALDAAGVGAHPTVMAQRAVEAEVLPVPEVFADVAEEMSHFTRAQILTQASTAMITQANSLPQAALQLLQ